MKIGKLLIDHKEQQVEAYRALQVSISGLVSIRVSDHINTSVYSSHYKHISFRFQHFNRILTVHKYMS